MLGAHSPDSGIETDADLKAVHAKASKCGRLFKRYAST